MSPLSGSGTELNFGFHHHLWCGEASSTEGWGSGGLMRGQAVVGVHNHKTVTSPNPHTLYLGAVICLYPFHSQGS